jgi:hypothetical protein
MIYRLMRRVINSWRRASSKKFNKNW